MDRKFRSFLQEYNYRLDKLQRKHIKRYIKNLFASKVRHALPLDQTKPLRSCPTPPRTRINTTPQHIDAAPSTYPLFQTEPSGSQRPFVSSLPKPPPTAFSPELELAFANATLCKAGVDRPYRSTKRGHCDFVREEYISLLDALDSLDHQTPQVYTADIFELRRQLRTRLTEGSDTGDVTVTEERMTAIIGAVFSQRETALTHRKKKNIRAFLVDIAEDAIPAFAQPRLAKPRVGAASDRRRTVTSLLRSRELGVAGPNRTALSTQIAEDIRPWRSWKGASSDVVTVAWAPDSLSYAAGAAAQSDEHDLQYNRACNLLFGDLTSNTICELPDHCVKRLRPKPVSSGPNTAYLIYQACDPVVYKTVTSVQFAPEDGILYTASHDSTVKIWDVTKERPSCQATLDHGAKVTSLEVSHHYPSHLATASETIENSVRVFQLSQGSAYQPLNFSSPRALKHREPKIFPECIRWGLAPGVKHLLLAGFQQWTDHDYSAARQGQICLWDVTTGASLRVRPHASAIFAVAWHPRDEIFVTGGAPGNGPLSYPRSTKSVVRSYDIRSTSSYTHEFECPALDINDVTLHPNSSYVTAGCTDGTTYVWDYRWPDDIMHQLQHGKPLQELGANEGLSDIEHREKADAGVLLSIWGKGASLMYTGSSDGVIKAWDILRAPEDVWVKDIARLPAGVQSGALSPDGMNMLVGDAVGGIHVLSATPFGTMGRGRGYHPAPIDFRYAHNTKQKHDDENPGTEGIQAANQKLQSGDIVLHPLYGVDRGPNYQLLANSSPRESQQQVFPPGNTDQQGHLPRIQALISARKAQIQAVKQALKPLDFTFGPPVSFVAGRHSSASASKPTITQSTPRSARPTDRRSLDPDADDLIYVSTFPSTGGAVKRKRPQHSAPACPSTPSSKRIKTGIITPSKSQSKHPQLARGPVEIEVIDLTGGGEGEDKPTRAVEREPEDGKKEEENLLSWADWVDEDWWWPEGC